MEPPGLGIARACHACRAARTSCNRTPSLHCIGLVQMTRPLVLRNFQSPGDVLMLSAALRDLHRACPGRYVTDVQSSFPEIWENNPYVTNVSGDTGSEVIECLYPAIDDSNRRPLHFLSGFTSFLSARLGEHINVTEFRGDIHLSEGELASKPLISRPYWIVAAGGKRDFTIKWWDTQRFQQVVDHYRGRMDFVQVGARGHFHPKLHGALDLRGRTSIRELIRLVYHCDGVLTPVSFLMHLAAAVPLKSESHAGSRDSRPCVVVAGGREPPHWEAYPTHQFIHTVGALSCCQSGGCWRSRTKPLGDGSDHDTPRRLCVDVVGDLPRCMDMITAEDVIRRIELYLVGRGAKRSPAGGGVSAATKASAVEPRVAVDDLLTPASAKSAMERAIEAIPAYPSERFSGRGIVICAGGPTYLSCAWVCINMLRRAGCSLPIELWHLGDGEMPSEFRTVFTAIGVELVDAIRQSRRHPVRRLGGWELKSFALLHCRFQEVILLDADNVPLIDLSKLFDTAEYRGTGAIFWPDIGDLREDDAIWETCGILPRREPEFESGQIVVDKQRCWRGLCLALWMNEHSDFFYGQIHGDKETFHLAFRKLDSPYEMPAMKPRMITATLLQHDFEGNVIFQHRNQAKWCLDRNNLEIPGFQHEKECRAYLAVLREKIRSPEPRTLNAARTDAVRACGLIQPPQRLVACEGQPRFEKRILFRGPINAYTGYGLHSCQIVRDLEKLGYNVTIKPTEIRTDFAQLPDDIRNRIVTGSQPHEWELLLNPPNIAPSRGKKTIFFTMWEASRLPREWVELLNRAQCIVVPCQWNAACFSASGVDRPIRIVPLGIKPEVFTPRRMRNTGPFVFGTGGRVRGGGERKSLNEAIELFQRAFPDEEDVRLRVKAFPDCGVGRVTDTRVEIIAAYLTEERLVDWYASLNCFVSLSRSEGWGLMPHQAMAVGRPCIAVRFGGHAEFIHDGVAFPLNYRLVPAGYNYSGGGVWAEPDLDHAVELMRGVYRNPKECRKRGEAAARQMHALTWEKSNRALLDILREFKMVL